MTPTTPVDDLDALLAAHAIGALDGEELELVEQVLATDAEARRDYTGYQRASAALRSGDGPGPGVWDSILATVEDDERRAAVVPIGVARQRLRVVRTIGLAAAIAIAAGLTAWGLDQGDSSPPPASAIERAAADAATDPDGEHITLTTEDGQTVEIVLLPDGRGFVVDGVLPRLVDGTYRLVGRTTDGVIQLTVIGDQLVTAAFALPANVTELRIERVDSEGATTIASALVPGATAGPRAGSTPGSVPIPPVDGNGALTPGSSTPAPPGVPPLFPTITLPVLTLPPLFG